jgi:phytoene synthase
VGLITRFPEIQAPVELLVTSCLADTQGVRIATASDLIRYCHGVAGTVGLIMYPILGGKESRGREYAADLGIAMQCTNIARDIIPDLTADRIYLPTEWIAGARMDALLNVEEDQALEAIAGSATKRLLALADDYYARGLRGLHYLNPRARFAIRVAAECYSAIGSRVIQNGKLSRARAVVPLYQKIVTAMRALRSSPHAAIPIACQDAS